MTVVINTNNDEEDLIMQNVIDTVFMQPLQTLEMLQSSFSTHPTLAIHDVPGHTQIPHPSEQSKEQSFLASVDSDVEEIQLGSEIVVDSPLYSVQKKDIPLAKVDNFVDEANLITLFDEETNGKVCIPKAVQNEQTTGLLLSCPVVTEGDIKKNENELNVSEGNYDVWFLNTIDKDAPLPGEVDDASRYGVGNEDVDEVEHITEHKILKDINVLLSDSHDNQKAAVSTVSGNAVNCEDQIMTFEIEEGYNYEHTRFTPKFGNILSTQNSKIECT